MIETSIPYWVFIVFLYYMWLVTSHITMDFNSIFVCIVYFNNVQLCIILLSLLSDRQVKIMNILTRFIDYHYKSIVSIIRAKHVFTLHLSTANWRKLTGSCCKNAHAHYVISFYQIESYHSSLSCGPLSMHFDGTLILLYFMEMLPHMVSSSFVWN